MSDKFKEISGVVWCNEKGCNELYAIEKGNDIIRAGEILPCGHLIASAVFNINGSLREDLEKETR